MTLRQLADRNTVYAPELRSTTVAQAAKARPVSRILTRLPWLDAVLGGGFVRGAAVMFHGAPGAGKSTMLAQAASGVQGSLYVSAEEDLAMVAARALRLGLRSDMALLATDEISVALEVAGKSPLLIIDSIQTMKPDAVTATKMAVAHARERRVAVALVCHETKSGAHAGLRLLEHLIDATIRLEREPRGIWVEKNRYGTSGVGLYLQMTERGLTL